MSRDFIRCWLLLSILACATLLAPPLLPQQTPSATPLTKAPPSAGPQTETGDEAGAAEILEKHIAALGGRELIHSVKTVERETEIQFFGMVNHNYQVTERATRRFYQRAEGPQGLIEQGFDGKRVWRKAAFFRGYLPANDPATRRALERQPELYEYKESGKKYFRLPNEKVGEVECPVVKSTTKDQAGREVPIQYYFDPASYLLRQTVVGVEVTSTTLFEDYRKVEGHPVAFTTVTKSPNITTTLKLKSIKYNVPVEPSRFEYQDDPAKTSGGAMPGAGPPSVTSAAAPAAAPPELLDPEKPIEEKMRLETFELVWKTIQDTYWDSKFGGVDWAAVHEKYLPRVKATPKNREFHRLLNQMVGELDRSHFRVTPPKETVGLHSRAEDVENGAVGLELRWVDGQLLAVDVRQDYPAEAAGIHKGFVLTKVNGKTPDELLADYQKKNPGFHLREEIQRVRAAQSELGGKPSTKVTLEALNAEDHRVQLELVRRAVPLDKGALEFASKRLENNIGYIQFNIFLGDLVEKFDQALRELRDTKALILDLRGNPGGAGQMAPTMAGRLSATNGSLGVLQFRYRAQPYAYTGAGAYAGRVVLLVDALSGSTAEVFSGGLQEAGRATIIGTTTAGAVLPSLQQTLRTGGTLQHVISDFHTPKGVLLEGRGVIPEIVARPSRAALLAGHDPTLERAIEFIQTGK